MAGGVVIPLPNGGESLKFGKLPGPVLDHVDRGSVNFSGMVSGLGQVMQSAEGLSRAMAPVLMNPRMFDGERQGMEALGQGVQALGSLFKEVAEREAQAKNYADMADAEVVMQGELADFETWKQGRLGNPETWGAEWERRLGKLAERFDKQEGWSPLVQQQLGLSFGRFVGQSKIRVGTDATKAQFARAGAAANARFDTAIFNNDLEGAKAAKADEVALGLTVPEQAVLDIQKAQRNIGHQKLLEDIKSMPSTVLSFLAEPVTEKTPEYIRDLNAAQKVEATSLATASLFDTKRDLLSRATQEIKSGGINDASTLEEWVKKWDTMANLDAGDLDHLESVMGNARPKNQDADWNEAVRVISSVPLTGTEAQRAKSVAYLKLQFEQAFDGPVLAELNSLLDEHVSRGSEARAGVLKDVIDASDKMVKEGKFGDIYKADLDAQGRALVDTPNQTYIPNEVRERGWYNPRRWLESVLDGGPVMRPGTVEDIETEKDVPVPRKVIDPIAEAKAQGLRKRSLQELQEWIAQQPVYPGRDQVMRRWNEITGSTRAAADAASFQQNSTLDPSLFGPATSTADQLRKMTQEQAPKK